MTTPSTPTPTPALNELSHEVRFAVVMYGGVSLASPIDPMDSLP